MFVRRAGLMSARVARQPPELAPRRGQNPPPFRSTTLLALAFTALGGCSDFGAPDPKLGVTASPRVTADKSVAKGGGAYKVGRPYKIAGRWYVPRRVASYVRTGTASWYGSAFHGRRTANGEVPDDHQRPGRVAPRGDHRPDHCAKCLPSGLVCRLAGHAGRGDNLRLFWPRESENVRVADL